MATKLTEAEYDQALADFYAQGGEPVEISSLYAYVIDPVTGDRDPAVPIAARSNIGKWNEEIYTLDADGTKRMDWGETIAARWENAPLLYGGGLAAGGFLLWRAFK